MIRLLAVIGLEFFALFLAFFQSLGGVRTDEAKMLLNIPYPHPPLLRWIVSQTEFLPFQEMLWRVLFASLLVQAVWFVWCMGRRLRPVLRFLVCALWLFSAAVLQQAGSIMTAPVTAVEGLVFCWLLLCRQETPPLRRREATPFIAFLFLLSLFTAYQVVLYLPLVVAILRMRRVSWSCIAFLVGSSLFLVALYAFSNPLSLDRFVDAGMLNAGKSVYRKMAELGDVMIVGGSLVGSILGILGMMRARSFPLVFSFLLVAAFVFLSHRSYYAILFLPLFVAGVILLFSDTRRLLWPYATVLVFGLLSFSSLAFPSSPSPAREIIRELTRRGVFGNILINGSFGHEWQYESRLPIRRYRPEFLNDAGAVVCLQPCEGMASDWQKIGNMPEEAWVNR